MRQEDLHTEAGHSSLDTASGVSEEDLSALCSHSLIASVHFFSSLSRKNTDATFLLAGERQTENTPGSHGGKSGLRVHHIAIFLSEFISQQKKTSISYHLVMLKILSLLESHQVK